MIVAIKLTVFGWFTVLLVSIFNAILAIWIGIVVSQVIALRNGQLDKDDGSIIGLAKAIYERWIESDRR